MHSPPLSTREESDDPLLVGVLGATGTTGAELVALLALHPDVSLVSAASRGSAGRSLRDIEPAAPDVTLCHPNGVDPAGLDVVFLCLPHGVSAPAAERFVDAGVTTIDLSGDFRLADDALHDRIYGVQRRNDLAREAVYGLTEHAREQLRGARLVANPGCYATCAMLPLVPLAQEGLLPELVVIDGKSGISGAGRSPTPNTHFLGVAGDVRPYKAGTQHRHVPEIRQALGGAAGPRVVFNPHVVPIERGIEETIVLPGADHDAVRRVLEDRYADEPFVDVLPPGAFARIRAVARTNRAQIAVHDAPDADAVVITATIDNLVKGAAGQAIQNTNVARGLDETAGLPGARQTKPSPATIREAS